MTALGNNQDTLSVYWGKLAGTREERRYHPLVYHLIDVAVVTEAMWDDVLPPAMRARIASTFGVNESVAQPWVVFFAALHDIGKLSPAFQCGNEPTARPRLAGAGLLVPASVTWAPHGTITARALPDLLHDAVGVERRVGRIVATAVGGHHGIFPRSEDRARLSDVQLGGDSWKAARTHLVRVLAEILQVPQDERPHDILAGVAMALAGLVSVADWIGSNTTYFPVELPWDAEPVPLHIPAYLSQARERARRALAQLHWTGWNAPNGTRSFTTLFPRIAAMNHMQEVAVRLAPCFTTPGLVIIEAPMGEGKTEAGFYLADYWSATLGQRGCYVALPTQATSNQMFTRLRALLVRRFPESTINLQLLHGHASLQAEFQVLRQRGALFEPTGVADDDPDRGEEANVLAAEWFTYRKRGLLAPFGVGTVDQALLAILRTKHSFVRLFGLANKTIVVDEVHAYDTYMSTLLFDLLRWLGALGSSVVLLSATLPSARRRELAAAYAEGAGYRTPPDDDTTPYPRLTWLAGSTSGSVPLATSARSRKTLQVHSIDGRLPVGGEPFALGSALAQALAHGGCAAVICSTVRRAQEMYQALEPHFPGTASDGHPALDLLHARFPVEQREAIEQRTRARFGPPDSAAQRPDRAVLVATQVIEQSLDLDFDLLVTDLAPVDLILQRVGRLHRHVRPRPTDLEQPTVWISGVSQESNGAPAFDPGTAAIYDRHVLVRTWVALVHLLAAGATVRIPEDVGDLIEQVYDPDLACPTDASEAVRREWVASGEQFAEQLHRDRQQAKAVTLLKPTDGEDVFEQFNSQLEEEDPTVHSSLQAATRLGPPSISLVLLDHVRAGLANLQEKPDLVTAQEILRRSVPVSHRGIYAYVTSHLTIPAGWKRSPLLRWQWPIQLDSDGAAQLGSYRLRLDPVLGVTIRREV